MNIVDMFITKDPKTELEGLDKALEILKMRYENKAISIDEFSKKCQEIAKKRRKYEKRLKKKN